MTKAAHKFLATLPPKQYRQVASTIFELAKNPQPQDSKQLKGSLGVKRVDVGEYRVIYRFDPTVVYIMAVGKRNDDAIYKAFKRLQSSP